MPKNLLPRLFGYFLVGFTMSAFATLALPPEFTNTIKTLIGVGIGAGVLVGIRLIAR